MPVADRRLSSSAPNARGAGNRRGFGGRPTVPLVFGSLNYFSPMRLLRSSLARRSGRVAVGGSLVLGSAAAGIVASTSAGATTTFHVSNLNDSGAGSLRQALIDATIAHNRGTVVVDPGVAGTITLTSGPLVIGYSLTVLGPGSEDLTISSSSGEVFFLNLPGQIPGYPPFDVTISGLTVTGGASGISALSANLVVDDVVIEGSTAGPAISTISQNPALSQSFTMSNSRIVGATVAGNGAGLSLDVGPNPVTITNSTISGNQAGNETGGLLVSAAGMVTISGCTISGNSSGVGNGGGASFAAGVAGVVIANSTIDGNSTFVEGGGLSFDEASVSIRNSTISNNSATLGGGGGIAFRNPNTVAQIANSTFVGNSAAYGGAIRTTQMTSLAIFQSTISQNTSISGTGGIFFYAGSALNLSGTILSNNSGPAGMQDLFTRYSNPTTLLADHSLLGVGTFAPNITISGSGNVLNNDPGLGSLAANGGPTKTMALLTNSVAIGAGPNPVGTFEGNSYDQRGAPWLRVSGGIADIGAYEYPSESEPVAPAFTG